jgi:two-component system, chemotaxis family, chemotaxis protein CheY
MKILIVDDSLTMRRIIRTTLQGIGYSDFVDAADGVEALKVLEGVEFIITDWNMPNMDGLTFVKTVRSNPAYKALPIIMVTTEAGKEDIMEAIKNGVNNYIVKPFTKEILRQKIDQTLAK